MIKKVTAGSSNNRFLSLKEKLNDQHKKYGRRWILVSDINGTINLEGVSPDKLIKHINEGLWGCVYNTGRRIDRVVNYIRDEKITIPQIIVSNNGTKRYNLKLEALNKSNFEIVEEDFEEDKESYNSLFKNFDIEKLSESIFMDPVIKLDDLDIKIKGDGISEDLDIRKEFLNFNRAQLLLNIDIPLSYLSPSRYVDTIKRIIFILKDRFNRHGNYRILLFRGHNSTPDGFKNWNLAFIPKQAGKETIVKDIKELGDGFLIAGDSSIDINMLFNEYEGIDNIVRLLVGNIPYDVRDKMSSFLTYYSTGDRVNNYKIVENQFLRIVRKEDNKSIYIFKNDKKSTDCKLRKGPLSVAYTMDILERTFSKSGKLFDSIDE